MANQRLKATVQVGSVLERSVKKNIGIIRSGLEGVGDEIKTITSRQKELSKQRKVLEKQGRSVAELDREYEQLGRQLDTLRRKQAAWTRAAQASQRVGQDFRRMTGNITRVARNAAVAVGAVGTAVFGLANSTASLGDDVAKSADKLGIGVEAFQELRYAAERSGVSVSTFDSSMTAFVKRLGEAKDGTGPAADAIESLGLNVGDLLAMKPEDALGEIAKKMKGVENPAERASIAADLFSRAGVGMVNMLHDGKSGLADLRDQARETGYVLSEETARDSETFQDRLLDAQLTIKGLKNVIGAEFMPVVQRSMESFTEWAKTNRDDVQAFAKKAVESLERVIPVVGSVASGMGEVAGVVGRVTSKVADMVGGWDNFGMILGTVMASKAIASVASFGLSVGRLGMAMWALVPALPVVAGGIKAIGLALVANPIGLAIAAIAGGAALIYHNWDDVGPWFKRQLGHVGDIFTGLADLVGGVFLGDMDRAVDGIKSLWSGFVGIWTGHVEAIGAVLKSTYHNVIKPVTDAIGITKPIERAWSWLGDKLDSTTSAIGATFEWLGGVIKPVTDKLGATDEIKAAWAAASDRIGSAVEAIGNRFGGPLRQAFDGFKQYVSGVWRGDLDAAAEGLGNVWEGAKGTVGAALDGMGAGFESAWTNAIKPVTDKLGVTDEIEAAWDDASGRIGAAVEAIGDRFGGPLRQAFDGFKQYVSGVWRGDLDAAAEGLGNVWEGAKGTVGAALNGMGARFESAWTNSIKPVTDKLGVTDQIEAGWRLARASLGRTLDDIKASFSGLGAFVGDVFTGDFEGAAATAKNAWSKAKNRVGEALDGLGIVFSNTWANVIKPVTDKLGVTDGIVAAWEAVKSGLETVLTWIGEKFDWVLGKIEPVINGLRWVRDKGAAALDAISFGASDDSPARRNPRTGEGMPGNDDRPPKKRAIGGAFPPGPVLVGERGPELRYEDRSGFIANNRATERIASLAAGARANIESAAAAMGGGGSAGGSVVNHIQINAAGMSASAILDELERRLKTASAGSLYDGPRAYGQYGGAA